MKLSGFITLSLVFALTFSTFIGRSPLSASEAHDVTESLIAQVTSDYESRILDMISTGSYEDKVNYIRLFDADLRNKLSNCNKAINALENSSEFSADLSSLNYIRQWLQSIKDYINNKRNELDIEENEKRLNRTN